MGNEPNTAQPDDDADEDVVSSDDQEVTEDESTTTSETTPPAAATEDDPEFGKLSPREKAIVNKARQQEKTKLYTKIRETEDRLRTLEAQQRTAQSRPPATTAAGRSQQQTRTERTESEIADLRDTVTRLSQQLESRDARERKRELRDYRNDVIADCRRRNVNLIDAMVTGDSEEMIDASLQVAIAEAEFQHQNFRQQYQIGDDVRPNNGRPATAPRRAGTVVVQSRAPRRPEGVPATVDAGVGGTSSEYFTIAQINEMSSNDAVRDGTFARNRDALMKALKEGRVRA